MDVNHHPSPGRGAIVSAALVAALLCGCAAPGPSTLDDNLAHSEQSDGDSYRVMLPVVAAPGSPPLRNTFFDSVAAQTDPGTAAVADELALQNGRQLTPHPGPAPQPARSYVYQDTADTVIASDRADRNFGGAEILSVTADRRLLLRFDGLRRAIGPARRVVSAKLVLHPVPGRFDGAAKLRITRLTRPWGEGGAIDAPADWAATWSHSYRNTTGPQHVWQGPGAAGASDRAKTASAVKGAADGLDSGGQTWTIGGLQRDLQLFYELPFVNFGWVLQADPTTPDGEHAFFSADHPDAAKRPMLLIGLAADSSGDRPPLDLSVTHVSRTPEQQRYLPVYDYATFQQESVGIMRAPGNASTAKWPAAGSLVTYTAHVKNVGSSRATGQLRFSWWRDQRLISVGTKPVDLPVGGTTELTLQVRFKADHADHRDRTITAAVLLLDSEPERTYVNNQRTIHTEGLAIGLYAERTMTQYLARLTNADGSTAFEDWAQWHVRVWNETFLRRSRSVDLAPDGCRERVRVQHIEIADDGTTAGGNHTPGGVTNDLLDGEWGWVTDADFARSIVRDIDRAGIHELTHQLGIIDIYSMNMEASLPDGSEGKVGVLHEGHVIGRGMVDPFGGLMGGGDTRPSSNHDPTHLLSRHSIRGLNSNLGFRRGFYGEYLYDLPAEVEVRILDGSGKPVPGASLTFWQSSRGKLPDWNQVFAGTTAADGTLALPNRSTLEPGPVTVATGHTLRANPFGRISVVGSNGVLLVRAEKWGQVEWGFVKLWQLNEAFWRGATGSYTHDLRLQLSPASIVPTNLAVGRPVVASRAPSLACRAVDGDLDTHWDAGQAVAGDAIRIDLGSARPVSEVILVHGGWHTDFFEAFVVEVSASGSFGGEQTVLVSEPLFSWTARNRRDVLPDDFDVHRVTYRAAPTLARYVRLRALSPGWVKVAEIEVRGPAGP